MDYIISENRWCIGQENSSNFTSQLLLLCALMLLMGNNTSLDCQEAIQRYKQQQQVEHGALDMVHFLHVILARALHSASMQPDAESRPGKCNLSYAISVRANQIFSAVGNSGTACPSGSLYLYKRLEAFKRFCWDFYKPEWYSTPESASQIKVK